jgi:transposase
MKAYSEDLRQKVVQAVHQRGISKSETARQFGPLFLYYSLAARWFSIRWWRMCCCIVSTRIR